MYAYLYTDIVPSASDAYRNQVRIYLAQGREKEAAELLAVAYKATGVTTFNTQRTSILPPTPGASVTAGYYTAKQTITFAVAEDYDVYYTFNDLNQLPEEGTLYTGPIELGEGDWSLRAVSVSGDLVSDVMKGSYQIYMPTPLQRRFRLPRPIRQAHQHHPAPRHTDERPAGEEPRLCRHAHGRSGADHHHTTPSTAQHPTRTARCTPQARKSKCRAAM